MYFEFIKPKSLSTSMQALAQGNIPPRDEDGKTTEAAVGEREGKATKEEEEAALKIQKVQRGRAVRWEIRATYIGEGMN